MTGASTDNVPPLDGVSRIIAIIDAAKPFSPDDLKAAYPTSFSDTASSDQERKPRRPARKARASTQSSGSARSASESDLPAMQDNPTKNGQPDDEPRRLGFNVEAFNNEYALVKVGKNAIVFQQDPTARLPEHQIRMLTPDALKTWFRNRFTEVRGRDGKIRRITWATAWLDSFDRRQYEGLEFCPDPLSAKGSSRYLNLWTGFAVAPAEKPDALRYKTFRDHLLQNVCSGNDALFRWLFAFFADMVQRPRQRPGIALVLRGKMGTGKTKVGEIFGALFPRHYFLVDHPRYVTGQFNAHMASCLLLQADEAVWAGDMAALGRLKGLITAAFQQIEAKGVDPIQLPNYVRLIMTSNEEWVVPAAKDERRFVVLDVDPRCARNHQYFADIDAEMAAGGLSHLLGDLLAFDLGSVDVRNAPRTAALLEQKIRSLTSVDSWWLERLMSGTTSRHSTEWKNVVACEALFDDYVAVAEHIGIRRRREQIAFGMAMSKLVPGLRREKHTVLVDDAHGTAAKRVWCYVLPTLSDARLDFAQIVEQPIEWPIDVVDQQNEERQSDEVEL
jgi:Family of unknown function (DUF5906)